MGWDGMGWVGGKGREGLVVAGDSRARVKVRVEEMVLVPFRAILAAREWWKAVVALRCGCQLIGGGQT